MYNKFNVFKKFDVFLGNKFFNYQVCVVMYIYNVLFFLFDFQVLVKYEVCLVFGFIVFDGYGVCYNF